VAGDQGEEDSDDDDIVEVIVKRGDVKVKEFNYSADAKGEEVQEISAGGWAEDRKKNGGALEGKEAQGQKPGRGGSGR